MPDARDLLRDLRDASARLLADPDGLLRDDAAMASASRCAGWTRAHLLTHLARNADSISGTLSAMLRGEHVAQYPGGREQRAAEIAAGGGRPALEVLADLGAADARLERVFVAVDEAERWDALADDMTAIRWVWWRLREVEIHHVDLDVGYGPQHWPANFVQVELDGAVRGLTSRTGAAIRVVVQGGSAPALDGRSWTVGTGEPVEVMGTDWAVLAWLLGRDWASSDLLTDAPDLR